MTITQESGGRVCVYRIEGALMVTERGVLGACIRGAVEDGARVIVLDLARAGFVDMGALGMLATLTRELRTKDGDLRLTGLDPALRSLFELAHLDELFPAYASVDEARDVDRMAPS